MADEKQPEKQPVEKPKAEARYVVRTKNPYAALEGAGFPRVSYEGANMGEGQKKAAEIAARQCGVALVVTKEG